MVHHATHAAAPAQSGADLSAHPPEPAAAENGEQDEDALEAGRVLFAASCRFMLGAANPDHLPPPLGPEIAFAGRSNVGKSSLLNALTGRRALARASGQPGRTRQLNFFDLGGRLTLVDMPGYGYAEAPKAIKEGWQGLMFDYLRGRPSLRRAVLLLDARIEVKPSDRAVMELLDRAAVTFQIVLTKADGVKPAGLARKLAEAGGLARTHPAAHPAVLATSAETGRGRARAAGRPGSAGGVTGPKADNASASVGSDVVEAPAPRRKSRMRWWVLFFLCIAAALYFGGDHVLAYTDDFTFGRTSSPSHPRWTASFVPSRSRTTSRSKSATSCFSSTPNHTA